MNHWVVSAELIERGALRYTPAGLPALDLTLKSANEVVQNGQPRKVELDIKAVVIGEITSALEHMPLGTQAVFQGFIAPSRMRKSLVFHITSLASSPPDN